MPNKFSEIVIEGPFVLVKGFLMGYLYGGVLMWREDVDGDATLQHTIERNDLIKPPQRKQ